MRFEVAVRLPATGFTLLSTEFDRSRMLTSVWSSETIVCFRSGEAAKSRTESDAFVRLSIRPLKSISLILVTRFFRTSWARSIWVGSVGTSIVPSHEPTKVAGVSGWKLKSTKSTPVSRLSVWSWARRPWLIALARAASFCPPVAGRMPARFIFSRSSAM